MTESAGATWLPNLIGGVSIWKIANDLNEPHMFGGRLLTPETEGSDSLPTRVEWKTAGLVPLDKARTEYGAECESAIADFQTCLKKVAKAFADEQSGYHKYRSAFTVPSIEAAGSPNYFYDPKNKKVVCINWGASPRSIGGQAGQFVYDHAAWGNLFGAAAAGAGTLAAASAVANSAAASPAEPPKEEEKPKDDGKKDDDEKKKKPIWPWILAVLAFLALLALILFLLKACQDEKNAVLDGGGDGALDSASLAEAGNDGAAATDGAGDATTASDAAADGSADAADASADASSDASRDGGDAGDASVEEDDIDVDDEPGGGGGSSGSGGGGAGGGGKPEIHVYTPKGTNSKAGPHRVHVHPDATKWRIVSGMPKVGRTRAKDNRFDVWLKPGQTFDGVKVEWQDKSGKWHAH